MRHIFDASGGRVVNLRKDPLLRGSELLGTRVSDPHCAAYVLSVSKADRRWSPLSLEVSRPLRNDWVIRGCLCSPRANPVPPQQIMLLRTRLAGGTRWWKSGMNPPPRVCVPSSRHGTCSAACRLAAFDAADSYLARAWAAQRRGPPGSVLDRHKVGELAGCAVSEPECGAADAAGTGFVAAIVGGRRGA